MNVGGFQILYRLEYLRTGFRSRCSLRYASDTKLGVSTQEPA